MGKNDFDIDFDFEKEYGFDPKDFLDSDVNADNIDFSEFSDEDFGLEAAASTASDDSFDLDEELNMDDFLNMAAPKQEAELDENDDFSDVESFFEKERVYEEPEIPAAVEPEAPVFQEEPVYTEYPETNAFVDEDEDEDEEEEFEEEKPRKERKKIELPKMPKITLPKLKTPNIFTKFYDLYFAPIITKELHEAPADPNNPRRRRRKSKVQIFKEVYLPPIIACVCLVLVMTFLVGSISNAISLKREEDKQLQEQLDASQEAAALQEQQNQRIVKEAELLAAGYDYEAAILKLDSIGDLTQYPDISSKRVEYVTAMNQLVEYNQPSLIPNISFHVLIEDMSRALVDPEYKGSYNKNFVTTKEFSKILEHLYANGYVLVDFDSFTAANADANGQEQFFPKSIWLPADKKPIMITETMVNYFAYMIDGDGDKLPDAKGDGFAHKLVLQNGEIKAEYIDANGNTLVGNYDLVPILEDFIQAHPDFSYQGARATLAVTGHEGVFGYRTNTAYIASVSQDYYDKEVAGAKEITQALRDKGYTIACYTYSNLAYGGKSAAQIQAEMQSWTQQITSVIGAVDTFVFAKNSNINDYSSNAGAFNVLYTTGFRYFVADGTSPWAEINTTYIRQNRLLVTGETMAWYSDRFTGMFDCAAILDVTLRGSVPKS